MGGLTKRGSAWRKGISITADKRKRIMICQEEKDKESWGGERARERQRAQGKTEGKRKKEGSREGEVSEGHGRNKHI